jgi:hypothetical protein
MDEKKPFDDVPSALLRPIVGGQKLEWATVPLWYKVYHVAFEAALILLLIYGLCQAVVLRPDNFPWVIGGNPELYNAWDCHAYKPLIDQSKACFASNGTPAITCSAFHGFNYSWVAGT